MPTKPDLATRFHQLHRGPELLILANAWDAGSARLTESLGARAVATTSAGVAWAHGYPDGDALPTSLLLASVAAAARAISVPLSIDIEGGYSEDPASVGELVASLVSAGAVGINIEDGAEAPDLLCRKIAGAKQAARRLGVELFINARTDVYLRGLVPEAARVKETLSRAARYREAGADGIFVPGLAASGEIRAIASATDMPLNLMALPDLPAAAELAALGVRRLSAGSAIAQSLWAHAAALADAFLKEGRSAPICAGGMAYSKINRLFSGG